MYNVKLNLRNVSIEQTLNDTFSLTAYIVLVYDSSNITGGCITLYQGRHIFPLASYIVYDSSNITRGCITVYQVRHIFPVCTGAPLPALGGVFSWPQRHKTPQCLSDCDG